MALSNVPVEKTAQFDANHRRSVQVKIPFNRTRPEPHWQLLEKLRKVTWLFKEEHASPERQPLWLTARILIEKALPGNRVFLRTAEHWIEITYATHVELVELFSRHTQADVVY